MKTKFIKMSVCICAFYTVFISCKETADETITESSTLSTETTNNETSTVADLTINTGMTLAQINQVIAAASSGQTVLVEAGTYNITGKIVMKSGVTLAKKTSTNPVFNATGASSELLSLSYNTDLNNCTFNGITFWNIRFVIANASTVSFKYCIFDYGKRKAGTNESYYSDAYLQFNAANTPLVSNCTFCRRVNNSGHGVWFGSGTTNGKIQNCTFGNGGSTGYFVTAINDNSQNNSTISGNNISRNPDLNSDLLQTDHGIYAHSFNGITISNNTISGWPANSDGGAVKARNGTKLNHIR